jgi:aminopeptidase N
MQRNPRSNTTFLAGFRFFLLIWIALLVTSTANAAGNGLEGEGQVELLHHDLTIELIPDQHLLKARDSLTFIPVSHNLKEISLYLNKKLTIHSIRFKDVLIKFSVKETSLPKDEKKRRLYQDYQNTQVIKFTLPKKVRRGEHLQIELSYQGKIYDASGESSTSTADADETAGLIGEDGVFLTGESHWYPDLPNSLFTSNLTVEVPTKWEIVTHGILVARSKLLQTTMTAWHSTIPADSLTVVAGKYVVNAKKVNGVELSTYLYPEDKDLAKEYLNAAAKYLETYSQLLGPYPFSKFVIVEGSFPAGLGFPSFTLLGSQVIKRHYTQPYALGHEIVHCWFGNYVFSDPKSGNWMEGLTAYLANYYYDEQTKGPEAAKAQRWRMMLEYSIYTDEAKDYPLDQFIEKESPLDGAIGYQKAAMVFHMLRNQIGNEAFFKALVVLVERFGAKRATWENLKKLFEETSQQDLNWFFQQWVHEKGAPILAIKGVSKKPLEKGYELKLDVAQLGKPFRLKVPVQIDTGSQPEFKTIELMGPLTSVTIETTGEPRSLTIDPDNQAFRRLATSEMPPNLNRYLQEPAKLVVYPTQGSESENKLYKDLAERIQKKSESGLSGREARLVLDTELKEEDLKGQSVMFLGGEGTNAAVAKIKNQLPKDMEINKNNFLIKNDNYRGSGNALLISLASPFNPEKILTIFLGLSESGASEVAPRLFYYGWDSYLVFDSGKVILQKDFPPQAEPMSSKIE